MLNKKEKLLTLSAAAFVCMMAAGCGVERVQAVTEQTVQDTESASEASSVSVTYIVESETETEVQNLITSVDYTSKDGTVKITLPDNTWKVTQDADEMRVFSSGNDAMINIVHASTESAMKTLSIQTSEDDLKSALKKQYSDEDAYDIESYESRTIDDVDIYRYVVKYNATARMWAYSVTYGLVAEDQAYVITGTVTDDNSTLLEAVENSVDSFTVLKDEDLSSVTGTKVTGTTQTETTATSETTAAAATAGTSSSELTSLQEYGTTATLYAADTVNVRSGPGTDTDVISGYAIGDAVTVTGETSGWFQVSIGGVTGYIRKDFLVNTKPSATTETSETTVADEAEAAAASTTAEAEAAAATTYDTATTLYATDNVNVRSGPSTDSSVSSTLATGNTVTVIGETDNWYIVSVGGATGYVAKSYLSGTQPSGDTATTTDTATTADGTTATDSTATDTTSTQTSGVSVVSGTVTATTDSTITIAGDDGNTYTMYVENADIASASGLTAGLYVTATVDNSQTAEDGTRYATNVTG